MRSNTYIGFAVPIWAANFLQTGKGAGLTTAQIAAVLNFRMSVFQNYGSDNWQFRQLSDRTPANRRDRITGTLQDTVIMCVSLRKPLKLKKPAKVPVEYQGE